MIGIELDKDIETKPSELRKEINRVAKELGCLYRSDHDTSTVHDSNIKVTSPTRVIKITTCLLGHMHQLSSEAMKACLP